MNKGVSIKVKNLTLNIGNTLILDDINLNLEQGKIHAIIGTNGAGKTTFLKCLLSQQPHTGDIEMIYEDKCIIGYVPQILDFEKTLPITVEDFLSICYQTKPAFFGPCKNNKKYFHEILEEVGLENKFKRLLGNLSGGELKRLLLAQAINPKPNLLILDEPLAGIDSAFEKYFVEIIQNLKDLGITIIWTDHNVKLTREVADTVTCFKNKILFHIKKEDEITEKQLLEVFT